MIDELLDRVAQYRSDAQDLRRKGRNEKNESQRRQLLAAAAKQFENTVAVLERGLRAMRRQQGGYTLELCRLLEAISQSYGSLGGTWRDAKEYKTAIEKYKRGNDYENERRVNCRAQDTYNMLQILVVRLLDDSTLLEKPDFAAELDSVRIEIERQVGAGRDDSWGLADLALARLLCGAKADDAIADLEKRFAAGTFYESAYTVVAALLEEGLGKDGPLADRLEAFKRLLQRKGGLA